MSVGGTGSEAAESGRGPRADDDARGPRALRIDHVTIAGSRLDPLREAFAAVGLETEYGGLHSNGVTHMAVLGFDDGSYIELISTVEAGAASPVWDRFIREDAGPVAWAVRTDDIEDEVARLRSAGVPVEGPAPWHRDRPDGGRAEWELAFPGEGPPGSTLPFLIEDRTPREARIRPSPSVAGSELEGVSAVVIAVPRLEPGLRLFRRAYGRGEAIEGAPPALEGGPPAPGGRSRVLRGRSPALGATLAAFPGQPAILAAPAEAGGWLAERLDRLGPAPCAFLLRTRDPVASERRFGAALGEAEAWPLGRVAWLDSGRLSGARLGVTPWSGSAVSPASSSRFT